MGPGSSPGEVRWWGEVEVEEEEEEELARLVPRMPDAALRLVGS